LLDSKLTLSLSTTVNAAPTSGVDSQQGDFRCTVCPGRVRRRRPMPDPAKPTTDGYTRSDILEALKDCGRHNDVGVSREAIELYGDLAGFRIGTRGGGSLLANHVIILMHFGSY
jgi:hypothetical protein